MKQQWVLNKCISNNDNFSMVGIGFLYKSKSTGKRANHWRDKERILTSVQSSERSYKKIEWEFHKIRRLRLTTVHVDQD